MNQFVRNQCLSLSSIFARVIAKALATVLTALFLLLCYAALYYRVHTTTSGIVDLRPTTGDKSCYVVFCASLADNAHGFPGHCYVVWSADPTPNLLTAESAAFMPRKLTDQPRSLWQTVPGFLGEHAAQGNMRNLDTLTVVLSPSDYEHSKLVRTQWLRGPFQVGVRDCVAFSDAVARDVGLHSPGCSYTFPQDYVRKLKLQNVESLNTMRRSVPPR